MKHLRVFVTVLCAAVLLLLGLSAPAQAAPSTDNSSDDRQRILEFFRQYDVPSQRWQPLIKKLQAGERWDSLAGVSPTNVEVKETADSTERISRFPDGSVMITTIERPDQVIVGKAPAEDAITPMAALRGCTAYTGSGYAVYRGCAVENQWGNVYVGFNANYQIINGTYDRIDSVHNQTATCWGWGWSCLAPTFDPVKYSEDGWGAARARLHAWVNSPLSSYDVWVQLNVGGNTAWASNS